MGGPGGQRRGPVPQRRRACGRGKATGGMRGHRPGHLQLAKRATPGEATGS